MNRFCSIKNIVFICSLGFLTISKITAQTEWLVPDDKKQLVSSFKFTESTAQKGAELFKKNCMSCHGEPSKGNFSKLSPPPGDPATDKFQKQLDGALFYKMTNGRGLMPQFKNILAEDERWQIISYWRTFNKTYIQPEPSKASAGKYGGMDIDVSFKLDTIAHTIKATAIGKLNNASCPVSGVEMSLYAKRYFGNLQIDESHTTNNAGVAVFDYKNILPGDFAGNVNFVVKLNAEGLSGFKKEVTMAAGVKLTALPLTDTRAMWTIRSKAPIWLIITYSLVVIGVWSFLGYIIFLIYKIRKYGSAKSNE